jgi:hypothetical protein
MRRPHRLGVGMRVYPLDLRLQDRKRGTALIRTYENGERDFCPSGQEERHDSS